jgi:hypothetical protein
MLKAKSSKYTNTRGKIRFALDFCMLVFRILWYLAYMQWSYQTICLGVDMFHIKDMDGHTNGMLIYKVGCCYFFLYDDDINKLFESVWTLIVECFNLRREYIEISGLGMLVELEMN